jgi:type II secretory pathway component GspD/PulD (secretin)
VLADVLKARENQNHERASALLAEARRRFEQNQFDEAERLTYEAENLRKDYPIWYRGERPDRLRAEIQTKRRQVQRPSLPPLERPPADRPPVGVAQNDMRKPSDGGPKPPPPPEPADPRRQQAQQMLAHARGHLRRGEYQQAVELALRVRDMNLPPRPGEDTADAVLQAVEALHAHAQARRNPQAADAARQQALRHLTEAQLFQKEGRLLDALQAVERAKQCNAIFGPNDELPETVLADLQRACAQQIETYTAAAETLKSAGRYQDAERYLCYVRDLAAGFRVGTTPVEQQLAEVRRLAAGQPATPPGPAGEGQRLLIEARNEIARGELTRARQLAELVYNGPYNLKAQANTLLTDLDEAEYRQNVKRAQTYYELGVRAYARREFEQAAAYLGNLDLRLLDPRKQAHAQEILSSKDLQPHTLVQARRTVGPEDQEPGRATVTDPGVKPVPPGEPDKPGLLAEVQARQKVELQRLRDEKLKSEQQANRLIGQGDYNGAIEVLENARAALRGANVDPELIAPMQRQLEERIKRYMVMREQVALEKVRRDQLNARNEVAKNLFLYEENKKQQVAELMKQYNAFMDQGKYKEAAMVAMKAREIDPDNVTADTAVYKAEMMRNITSEQQRIHDKEQGIRTALHETNGVINVDDLQPVSYPEDFRLKEGRRKYGKALTGGKPETAADRETASKLSTPVSVEFRDKPLAEVLEHLSELSGVDLVPDKPFIELDGISLAQPVTIRLNNQRLKDVLDLILHNARLTYVIKNGVVVVTTPAGQKGKLVQKIYPVADLVIPIENYGTIGTGTVNIAGIPHTGQDHRGVLGASGGGSPWQIQGGSPVSQYSEAQSSGTFLPGTRGPQPGRAPRQPGQTIEETLIQLIMNSIEPLSWDSRGGAGHIEYYPLGMQLVINQTPDIQEQIQILLDRLRELQELQVTVEVRFITLSESFYERIGIDFDINIDDDQTRFEPQVVSNSFAPPGFINESDHLDNVVVGLTPTGNFTTDLDIPITTSSFNRAIPPFGGYPSSPGANGGIDLGLAFLSDIEVFLFLEAAQGDTRSNVMQAPKITLYNGQIATLDVVDFQFFVTSVRIVTGPGGQLVFEPVNTPFFSGLTLTLQAVVSADRRYVRLSLNPTFQTIGADVQLFPITVFVTPIIADDIQGTPIPFQQFVQQPQIGRLSVTTTVSVPDGGTILMGGLKTLSEGRNEFGPPILSKIPYINRLFRNVGYGREAQSLMIMVTPRIIIPEEEEERLAQTFAF